MALNAAWFPLPTTANVTLGRITDDMDDEQRLFHYAHASQNDEVHVLEFRQLQRINIFHLQNELAKLKASCRRDKKAAELDIGKLKTTLHDYATAIREYSYLKSLPELIGSQAESRRRDATSAFPTIANSPGDPFNSRYRTLPTSIETADTIDPLRMFLKASLPRNLTYTDAELHVHDEEFLARKPPTTVSPFVDRLARFIVAFVGGASLVVPMLIMTLPHQRGVTASDSTKSLITTSVAVTLFAAFMALLVKASNVETLAATATYAAVLVVFVGTSLG